MNFFTNTLKQNIVPGCCLQRQTSLVYEIKTNDVY